MLLVSVFQLHSSLVLFTSYALQFTVEVKILHLQNLQYNKMYKSLTLLFK